MLLDTGDAAVDELLVADRQHFVDEEDLGVGMDGDREAQAHVHARGVVLDRLLDEIAQPRELHDVVVALFDPAAAQAEQGAVDEDVLPARDLGVEAGAELDQGGDPAVDRQFSGRGPQQARDQLDQRRLAGTVCRR